MLLKAPPATKIETIHRAVHSIKRSLGDGLSDIVPAYDSIALFGDDCDSFIDLLSDWDEVEVEAQSAQTHVEIPICYEMGLDTSQLAESLKIKVEELIKIHVDGLYRSLFVGFTPGFIYADGLDRRLFFPRKKAPRTRVPEGSVGIAGEQTGIYSLDSPGGWNIIGRTPLRLFDIEKRPPMKVQVGTSFSFRRISTEEFEAWRD